MNAVMKHTFIVALISASIVFSLPVAADSDQCGQGPQSILSESTSALSGDYTIYAKLSLPGQNAAITAYSVTENCNMIGSGAANGDTWTKVGSASFNNAAAVSFEIDGDIPGNNEAAAKPKLLMVPATMPCIPNVTCGTTVDGLKAYLNPIELATSTSGLVIEKIIDPATDMISRVEYYTNGQLMYTTHDLRPFDTAFADYYQQSIARVVVYTSGQRAVIEDSVGGYADTLLHFAARTFVRHSTLIITIAITIILWLFIFVARTIVRKIERQQYYNYAHGLGRHELTPWESKISAIVQNSKVRNTTNILLVTSAILVTIVITNSFIIAPYKVDGTSMKGTLNNDQVLAVNKLPVSLTKQFLPTRGQVIIFHPNYGNLGYSDLRVDNLLVKRIVGLPGERVVSVGGKLKIYNATDPSGYIVEDTENWGSHVTIEPSDAPFDITLANDEIFVAGDNRPDSIDSRINGVLPLSEVVGVVIGY